jgi:arabinose-5-phosphate isomerase
MKRDGQMLIDVAQQLGEPLARAVQAMASCKGHVIVSGVGTTGMVGRRFSHLLCCVGCPSLFLHGGDSMHGASVAVKAEDVLFLLSRTGETDETCQLARIASERGTTIITLTAKPDSTLGRLSGIVLKLETPADVDPYGGAMSLGSSLAMAALCDAIVVAVLEEKGTTKSFFLDNHPGGIARQL